MNTMKWMGRLAAAAGILFALAVGPAITGDRVHELCVVAGDIGYCAPQRL